MRFLTTGLLLGWLALPALAQVPQGGMQGGAQGSPYGSSPGTPYGSSQGSPYGTSQGNMPGGQQGQPGRPVAPAPRTLGPPAPGQAAIDLNLATLDELQLLPGIGPSRAAAIVTHRPYRSADEVVTKASVPSTVISDLRGRITTIQVNVNAATKREMVSTLPGIGDARADAIIKGRPYARPEELVSKGGVPQATFERIRQAITLR